MNLKLSAAPLLAVAVALSGCATVTRGTQTQFAVETTPPGAALKTSTGFSCSPTPCSVKMPRKEPFDATVTLDGYQPVTTHISSRVGGAGAAGFAGNVVAGGVLGMAIDGTSGAMDDLSPNPLKVTLEPVAAPVPPTAAATPETAPAPVAAADPAAAPHP